MKKNKKVADTTIELKENERVEDTTIELKEIDKAEDTAEIEPEENTINITIDDKVFSLIIPYNFLIEGDKIYYYDIGKEEKEIKLLSSCLVFITGVILNTDNNTEKLVIAIKKYGKWKTGIFKKSQVYNSLKLLDLADFGIPVNSRNSIKFIEYLSTFENINTEFKRIPIKKSVSKLGWANNNTEFVPYSNNIMIEDDLNSTKWIGALSTNGTLEEWVNGVKYLRVNKLFRFILSASFSSPLISLLNQRIFVIHNYGASRAGKSAMLQTALSVWGKPEDMICTFNSTTVGMERLANFYNNLVLAIDERQINNSQKELEKLIFTLSSGLGKVRGNKTGGIQALNEFKLLILIYVLLIRLL